jgi:hypothetical protein
MGVNQLHEKMATALHILNYCRRETDRARIVLLFRERALAEAETTYYALEMQVAEMASKGDK